MLKLSAQRIDKVIKEENLYSLRALQAPSGAIILARILMVCTLVLTLFLFLPWQQNVRGIGSVTALNPANRPQTVQAIIAGQINSWHVREGQFVQKGDTIVSLREVKEKYFDPQLLTRLQEQLSAKKSGLQSKTEKSEALQRQIAALKDEMKQKIQQGNARLAAEKVKFANAENQYQRNKKLFEAGNIPLTKFQDITYKYEGSTADYGNAKTEIARIRAEYMEKISKSESELGNTKAEIFETVADISKVTNEYTNTEMRSMQYQITAPQSGYVIRAMKAGIGETIKEGDPVCTIMPEASDLAVEMYVRAMDVPLITKGRKVRVEFDGWPALQFSGWPSVSVGTFGGTVEVIDYVTAEPGKFRILVVPDASDDAWPSQLRVGSGTRSWIMLDNVPVWYELWRQLNGFPPSLYRAPLQEALDKKTDTKEESNEKP